MIEAAAYAVSNVLIILLVVGVYLSARLLHWDCCGRWTTYEGHPQDPFACAAEHRRAKSLTGVNE